MTAISIKKIGRILTTISMTHTQMFPRNIFQMENFVVTAKEYDESTLWHIHYSHLNLKGLRLLRDKIDGFWNK